MRFLADECCDSGLVKALRNDGHDVLYAAEEKAGWTDKSLLNLAFEEERIIITEDKDFGELLVRFRHPIHGLILVRFPIEKRHLKTEAIHRLIGQGEKLIRGYFIIVDPNKIRRHTLQSL